MVKPTLERALTDMHIQDRCNLQIAVVKGRELDLSIFLRELDLSIFF